MPEKADHPGRSLPIDALLPALERALEDHCTVLVQAPPGAGKTTRVPPALERAAWRNDRRIVMLEPRRLAARAAARFMARERGEDVGCTVGLRTRLETRVSKATRIEVVTEGVLVRMLQSDPELRGCAAVVFDEFHERSLPADLGLVLVRDVQQALREDLRVVVMSATLDTGPLSRYLGGPPVLTSEGRSFPVDIRWCPPRDGQRTVAAVAAAIRRALTDESGSILVFLPGVGEIRRVGGALDALPEDVDVRPLFGALPPDEQDAAIAPAPAGRRKIVLATSIAETSLTIEGIGVVVDAGLARRARFDPGSGMTRLVTVPVSRAAAEQRAGRAGRTGPGTCYRLWSETRHRQLEPYTPPEILEADLAPVVLELAHWGATRPDALAWPDRPAPAHWNQAVDLLRRLDALDPAGLPTATGRDMLHTGIHPRPAHMLVRGRALGMGQTAARLAALLAERDVLGPGEGADLESRLALLDAGSKASSNARARPGALREARRLARRLADGVGDTATPDPGLLLALAFPDRIARRRSGATARYLLSNGRGAWLPEDDPLAAREWLVAAELDGKAREARIFQAVATDPAAIESALADRIEEIENADWDDDRGTVVVRRQRRLGALVLAEHEAGRPDPEQLRTGLLAAVRRRGLASLSWTEAAVQFCHRVEALRVLAPDRWPAFNPETLCDELEQWLAPFLAGMTHWRELAAMDLIPALAYRLGPERRRELDRLAPARIEVPTGQAVKLDYAAESGPVLAVKLQALFGWTESPRIADGRLPIVVHLLDPAGRPLAVTADLTSFWANAYPDVARQMRGRYPKHPWPDNPLSASPTMGTKRRGP